MYCHVQRQLLGTKYPYAKEVTLLWWEFQWLWQVYWRFFFVSLSQELFRNFPYIPVSRKLYTCTNIFYLKNQYYLLNYENRENKDGKYEEVRKIDTGEHWKYEQAEMMKFLPPFFQTIFLLLLRINGIFILHPALPNWSNMTFYQRNMDCGIRKFGFESWFCYLLTVWAWAITKSLHLTFAHIYKNIKN